MSNNIYPSNLFIQKNNYKIYNINYSNNKIKNSKSYDIISFSGHLGAEKYAKNGIQYLISETSLFRDIETKKIVVDYVLKNFSNEPNIRMLVGACSTGEEAYTYSMLLKNIKDKVSILGFDLSPQSIKSANSGTLAMYKRKEADKGLILLGPKDFSDSFLCFNSNKMLSAEEFELKNLFNEFFEVTSESVTLGNDSLVSQFKKWYFKNLLKLSIPEYERKIVKLKDSKVTNCNFIEGDILKLNNITNGKKYDVITFSNAMYHLITENFRISTPVRKLKPNAVDIVRKIGLDVKDALSPKGLFVLGENERLQINDSQIVPKVLKELGFEPMNSVKDGIPSIWTIQKK